RLKDNNVVFRVRKRIAQSMSLVTPYGNIQVWNAHLDTRVNRAQRLEQLKPVLEDAQRASGPRLIGGGFYTDKLFLVRHVVPLPYGHCKPMACENKWEAQVFRRPSKRASSRCQAGASTSIGCISTTWKRAVPAWNQSRFPITMPSGRGSASFPSVKSCIA